MAQPTTDSSKNNKDAMLNLFQVEVKEDSGLGKFADSLEEIEISALLENAVEVRNKLKGSRK